MRFVVRAPEDISSPAPGPDTFVLSEQTWDDWFTYNTKYHLRYIDPDGESTSIGSVKVGQFGMSRGQRRAALPRSFDFLRDEFFSLGQEAEYYENLNALAHFYGASDLLGALRDLTASEALLAQALREDVTGTSLMRFVSLSTIEGQFRRIARGGARLSDYAFDYVFPQASASTGLRQLAFDIEPESLPPSNIHVIIGRNGVGKTRLLTHMTRALADEDAAESEVGHFQSRNSDNHLFANLISVSFSAFDTFEPLSASRNKGGQLEYGYLGLKRVRQPKDGDRQLAPKSPTALANEFSRSVRVCIADLPRLQRWRRALQMLEADPIFADAQIADLADEPDEEELRERASALYKGLSSGHKIVLLTMTRLVEMVQERSLVLMDEPEAHLHPPLLSALIRALSDLLVNRNGVAVIATHSPVVLQEVPRDCAWRLRRSGRQVAADRPSQETFGENLGVLTRDVFGLEVTLSGFHRLLNEAVESGRTYAEISDSFDGRLGDEARALLRTMISLRDQVDA